MAVSEEWDVKKVGVRIESRFHEIEDDTSEAFCYFAEMVDSVSASGGEIFAGIGDEEFTASDAEELTGLVRDLLLSNDENISIYTEGELRTRDGRVEVRYREPDDALGLGSSVTSITFDEADRDIVTITRGGEITMALVLERGVRHACAYNTPVMPMIIYTTAKRVDNRLTDAGGALDLIYTVETQGGAAQFNRVTVTVNVMEDQICPL